MTFDTTTTNSPYIMAGHGFHVGQDFARARIDTLIELAPNEHANPRHVIGYIQEQPDSTLGFLRRGDQGKIRVHVQLNALGNHD